MLTFWVNFRKLHFLDHFLLLLLGGCRNWSRRFFHDSRFGPDLVQSWSRSRYMAVQIPESGRQVRTCRPDFGLVQTSFSQKPSQFFDEAAPPHSSRPAPPCPPISQITLKSSCPFFCRMMLRGRSRGVVNYRNEIMI